MEGACGKNPVYHVGKLYSILSFDLARRIHERWNTPAEVWLVGQEGRRLNDPWQVIVRCGAALSKEDIARVTEETLATLPNVTQGLLTGTITPY
jgi:S-adenosylmethionine synthetase